MDAVKGTLANYLAAVAAVAIIFAIIQVSYLSTHHPEFKFLATNQIIIIVVSIFVAAEKKGVKYDTMSPGEDKQDIHDDAPTS